MLTVSLPPLFSSHWPPLLSLGVLSQGCSHTADKSQRGGYTHILPSTKREQHTLSTEEPQGSIRSAPRCPTLRPSSEAVNSLRRARPSPPCQAVLPGFSSLLSTSAGSPRPAGRGAACGRPCLRCLPCCAARPGCCCCSCDGGVGGGSGGR